MELSEIFVTIRGDATALDQDFSNAHTRSVGHADRLSQDFSNKLMRGLGVFQLMRMGAQSVASGLQSIQNQNLINPENAQESIAALLAVREETRKIVEMIPLLGGVGASLMRGFSDDKALKQVAKDLDQGKGAADTYGKARSRREAATIEAKKAAGASEPELKKMAADAERRALEREEKDLRRQAAEQGQIETQQTQVAESRRAMPAVQKFMEGGIRGNLPGTRILANKYLNEAETADAAAAQARTQRIAFERAARETRRTIELKGLSATPVQAAGAGAVVNEVGKEKAPDNSPRAVGQRALAQEEAMRPEARLARRQREEPSIPAAQIQPAVAAAPEVPAPEPPAPQPKGVLNRLFGRDWDAVPTNARTTRTAPERTQPSAPVAASQPVIVQKPSAPQPTAATAAIAPEVTVVNPAAAPSVTVAPAAPPVIRETPRPAPAQPAAPVMRETPRQAAAPMPAPAPEVTVTAPAPQRQPAEAPAAPVERPVSREAKPAPVAILLPPTPERRERQVPAVPVVRETPIVQPVLPPAQREIIAAPAPAASAAPMPRPVAMDRAPAQDPALNTGEIVSRLDLLIAAVKDSSQRPLVLGA